MNNNDTIEIPSGSTLISGEYFKGLCLSFTMIGLITQVTITFFAIRKNLFSSLTLSCVLISISYIPLLISQSLNLSPGFQASYFILFGAGSVTYLTSQWFLYLKKLSFLSPQTAVARMLLFSTLLLFITFLVLPCILSLFPVSIPILNLCSIWTLIVFIESPLLSLSIFTVSWRLTVSLMVMIFASSLLLTGVCLYGEFESRGLFVNGVVVLFPGLFLDGVFGLQYEEESTSKPIQGSYHSDIYSQYY